LSPAWSEAGWRKRGSLFPRTAAASASAYDYSDNTDGDRAAADGDNSAPNFTSTDDNHAFDSASASDLAATASFISSAVVNDAAAAACFNDAAAASISFNGDDI